MSFDLITILGDGSYDEVTGNVSFMLPEGLPNEEAAVLAIAEKLENAAQGKRTNLDSPIGEKALPDAPSTAIVARENDDGSQSEEQIERIYQFVGFYKLITPTAENAVNDSD